MSDLLPSEVQPRDELADGVREHRIARPPAGFPPPGKPVGKQVGGGENLVCEQGLREQDRAEQELKTEK